VKGAGSERPETRVIRGRGITACDIGIARRLAEEYAGQGRFRIALELAQHWQWRSGSGRFKQRSALAVLVELEKRGYLSLPAPFIIHGPRRNPRRAAQEVDATAPENGVLGDFRLFGWQLADSAERRREWRELLAQHHYLGAPGLVGAHLQYLVYSRRGDLLGAVGWQSAVERLDCRDRLVGLPGRAEWRPRFLEHAVNNVRFLILRRWRVRHLASALLAESLERLQRDWPRRYGAPVWLAESFVDRTRFSGASYRAANWVALGWTRGYAKEQGQFLYHGQPKEVYVYVIEKRLRQILWNDPAQALLTRDFLLAQRPTGNPPPQTRRKSMSETLSSWAPKLPPQWELSVKDLENVRQDLNEFTALFSGAFRRIEPTELCELYLQGLLSGAERKNVEAIALEISGPETVRNLQRFMAEYAWDESWMRQEHWKQAAQELADEQGVWSIDASEFSKKGEHSVGVAHQYCGALGKTANCQSGVFICYSSPKGHTLLDARLYLPRCWLEEESKERREKCRVPKEVSFHTKPELALELGAALWKSGLFPGQWITCDASFGNNEAFLAQLPKDKLYLAEISCTRKVWLKDAPEHPKLETDGCTVEPLVQEKNLLSWSSHKITEGEKGPIVAGFARVRVYLSKERTAESERTLLLRNDPNGQLKYALSNAPEDTALSELIRVSGSRWPIERCFQEGKSELGLDHYEHRSWPAWHRHMRLVFLAHLFLLRLRVKYKKSPGVDAASSTSLVGVEPASSSARPGVSAQLCSLSPTT
jgi:SRSO17 transposase